MLRLFRYLHRRRRANSGESNRNNNNNRNNNRNAVALITFDVSLPLQHGYLGNDLQPMLPDASSSQTAADSAEQLIVELPYFVRCPLGVVVPGQIVPVTLHHPVDVSAMSALHRSGPAASLVAAMPRLCRFGATLRILAFKEETDDSSGLSTIKAKLIGWQRFELLSARREFDGRCTARVRLLPELTNPRLAPLPGAWHSARSNRRLNQAASPAPAWVMDSYRPSRLATEAAAELSNWCPTVADAAAKSAEDPLGFSYWLMRQLPFPDWLRSELLACEHPCRRLVACLAALRRCLGFACGGCAARLAGRADLICLSNAGCSGAYVNPSGQVHDLVTVATVTKSSLRCRGWSSSEHSWFPGYEWRVANCRSCGKHIGWRFDRSTGQRRLQPKKFWGLCRSALSPCWVETTDETADAGSC
uniref:Protein cereblon n=2 Tax=Macrostomum lignano TaxID=282301 RepID=A0A1I8IHQ1_9PLAT